MVIMSEPESSTLEYKERLPQNEQILKTVVGFCNGHGGRLIVGVNDRREAVGLPQDEIEALLEHVHKSIYECCSPSIVPDIYTQRVNGALVLVIKVSSGGAKPYYIKAEGPQRGTYVRLGRSTMRADAETIADLGRQGRGVSYDATPAYGATTADIDKGLFSEFLSSRPRGSRGNPGEQVLAAYGALRQEQGKDFPTVGGILLFCPKPQQTLPEAFIICSRFKGTSGRDASASRDCTGTLFEQFDAAYEFVLSTLSKTYVIRGRRREERYELPAVALREVILNAIVHRNYAVAGPTKIAVYDDRVEVFSPGTFPGPIDITHLTSGITYIRNSVISRVFREAGYIEKLGSGFITLFQTYHEYGLQPPTVMEGGNFVKVVLPRHGDPAVAEGNERRILGLLYESAEIGVSDVMKSLGTSRASAGRILNGLVARGTLHRTGKGPATRYKRA